MDKESRSLVDNPASVTRKKPPKLKAIDRSISIAIDNYTPAPTMIVDDSLILEEPPPPIPTQLLAKPPDIYFVSSGRTSPLSATNTISTTSTATYDDCPHHIRKSNFRRSDTINVHSPSNFQMRKTHSFHANEPNPEEFLLSSRRTSSVRGSYLFPQVVVKEGELRTTVDRSPDPNRRSCRMHRSFNEPKRPISKTEITIEGIKYPSLNDDSLQEVEASMQPLAAPMASLEPEVIRSRSNSHSKIEEDTIFEIGNGSANSGSRKHHHKHSSHSLEGPQQPHTGFKRGGKHTHSLYLSPNSFEELQIHRSLQGAKKSHSASVRVRPYRESLSATKKSKSFMIDTYPEFELSPHRRDSRILVSDDIKRSPRPSTTRLMDEHRSSFDRKSSHGYDVNDLDFEQVLRPFRQSRRKSSVAGSVKKLKKKSLSDDTDEDDESDRKRKRIVCIIMTVFLCLVCASVFVVVITLTHSSVAQGKNQTKKIYTFSRDSPIHYNGMF
ncbi:unnamed protein product [Hermetia illucens]|uniref:Uncharacterized protein n=1 Tax=Hermetia illucens TaxID=343691 RepID=A0A7R8UCH1_HERIL|nr:unnamed protein product [Hermetia illucens]